MIPISACAQVGWALYDPLALLQGWELDQTPESIGLTPPPVASARSKLGLKQALHVLLDPLSLRRPCVLAFLTHIVRDFVLRVTSTYSHIVISLHTRLGAHSMHHGSYFNTLDPKLEKQG